MTRTEDNKICEKILQDIKSCLQLCKNNKRACDFKNLNEIEKHDPLFYLLECENIQTFKHSLNDVNIKMIIKDPLIITKKGYCIDYNCSGRELIIGSAVRCECDEQSNLFYKNLRQQRQGKFWVKTCKD
jgi:hypothetical protein